MAKGLSLMTENTNKKLINSFAILYKLKRR